jgi:Nucleotidyl transferase of unknown function (DUF2204)
MLTIHNVGTSISGQLLPDRRLSILRIGVVGRIEVWCWIRCCLSVTIRWSPVMNEHAHREPGRERSVVETYQEGLRLFMGEGELNQSLARLVRSLDQHGIDYVVVGAVALIAHGYKRFTEDIDLVLTQAGLDAFHGELIGIGYAPAFPGARKKIRSTHDGINIDIITSGEYPGDGKPKPVAIPRPDEASTEIDGIRIVTLDKLIELKLASGMTAPDRLRDLADVQELIKIKKLDAQYANRLDPYVREKYLELWNAVATATTGEEPGTAPR